MAQPFAEATAAYRSPLWEFLVRRDIAPAQYTDFLQKAVTERGWHRTHARDLDLYREYLGPSEPAAGERRSTAYSAMLHRLANEATPDALAILIALFREALHAVRLEEALLIKPAVGFTVQWMCRRLQLPDELKSLLTRLVHDRVLANVWITEADWRQHTGRRAGDAKTSRDRIHEFRTWVEWYVAACPPRFDTGDCVCAMVPTSPRIDWLEANKDLLERLHDQVWGAADEQQFRLVGTGSDEESPWLNRDDVGAWTARALGCPEAPSPRFYSESPPLVMGWLPRPY